MSMYKYIDWKMGRDAQGNKYHAKYWGSVGKFQKLWKHFPSWTSSHGGSMKTSTIIRHVNALILGLTLSLAGVSVITNTGKFFLVCLPVIIIQGLAVSFASEGK